MTEHRVFVTAGAWFADFGGLSVADGYCQDEGNQINSASKWVAILSDATVSAKDRIQVNGPVFKILNSNKFTIASNASDLWSGNLLSAINSKASGDQYYRTVWSGTTHEGLTSASGTCNSWTGTALAEGGSTAEGRNDSTGPTWISANALCNVVSGTKGFYCIEQ